MQILKKNVFWMIVFSIAISYWLFNPSAYLSLIMIIPLLMALLLDN